VIADLHMHSTVSDGWRDPDEVAHLAADHGVGLMALTDHDSFYGVARAKAAAHGRGLGYLPGVEITTYPPSQMRHILGHGVDIHYPQLLALLRRSQAVLRCQAEAWIAQLLDGGIGRELGVTELTHKPMLMPGAVLKLVLQHRLMTEKDAWNSIRQAVDGLPSRTYASMPSTQEAVEVIHAAGGLAVHAHPGSVPDQDLLLEVLPLLDGLEVYTRRHSPVQVATYEELADRHRLPRTTGTDFHGFNDEAYAPPSKPIDRRYLERVWTRVEWPALERAV
jgi:predicted metal-dependent phosphoesterase TrpH